MNEHAELHQESLEEVHPLAERADGDGVFVQDGDYPIDPLDDGEINAFVSASELDRIEALHGAKGQTPEVCEV